MSDPRALLDALDEAHAKATPGDWYVPGDRPVIMFSNTEGRPGIGSTYMPADAAAIVAAHNALPALTAAVRAALALADELEVTGRREDAEQFRATVTAALTVGQA